MKVANMTKKQKPPGTETREHWDTVAEMLGIKEKAFSGGIESCGFSAEQLAAFLDLGFITLDYKFNYSPTVKTFFEFGKRAEARGASVEYIGFLEPKYRPDAQIVVEGINRCSLCAMSVTRLISSGR